ncbi:MAG: protein translocase subunit SecD [Ktedonobacterales bacterium]
MRRQPILMLLFILVLGVGAFYVDFGLFKHSGIYVGGYQNDLTIKQGLDLKGGIQIVMEATCPPDDQKCDIPKSMPGVINNINTRVSRGLGLNDAIVRQQGDKRILIQLPGLTNDKEALDLIGKTGDMRIIDTGGTPLQVGQDVSQQMCTTNCQSGQYKVVFTGKQLDSNAISASLDQQSGQPVVTFAFTGDAKNKFGDYTKANIGKYLTIVLDGKVIESATIQSEIDSTGQITGIGSITDAQNIATQLKYGSLPLPLHVASESQLAPTLGQQALKDSELAAIIGLGLAMLFMLVYYRLPGLIADLALALYALFLFATIKILGVTLSLPGIAAVILTIGMAVDANVLIFERIKEELRGGRTMAAAVDIGFKRAWPSIRDSNASTMITCGILYIFGNNFGATLIVGFAINLFVGVAISLFTAVTVTRTFLNFLIPTGIATHPALYGLPRDALNLPRYNRPTSRVTSRPDRAVLVPSKAAEPVEEDAESDDSADDDEALEPVGNALNGRSPRSDSSNTAGTTGGAEE